MLILGVRAHDIHAENIEELAEKVHQFGLNHIQFAPTKSFPVTTTEQLTPGLGRHCKDIFERKGISISVRLVVILISLLEIEKSDKRNFKSIIGI